MSLNAPTKITSVEFIDMEPTAMVHRGNGKMFIANHAKNLPKEIGYFIVLHEAAHATIPTTDEIMCDTWAFNHYVHKYPAKHAVYAISKILKFQNKQDFDRLQNIVNLATNWELKNGNQKAIAAKNYLKSTNMNLSDNTHNNALRPMAFSAGKINTKSSQMSGFDWATAGETLLNGAINLGIGAASGAINNAVSGGGGSPASSPANTANAKAILDEVNAYLDKLRKESRIKCPKDWDEAQKILDKGKGILSAGTYQSVAKSIQQGRDQTTQYISEYNQPKNVASRKFYYAFNLAKTNPTPEILYAAKVLKQQATTLGGNTFIVTGRGTITSAEAPMIADLLTKIDKSTMPSGFTTPESVIQFPIDRIKFTGCDANPPVPSNPLLNAPSPSSGSGLLAGLKLNPMMILGIIIIMVIAVYFFFVKK